MAFLDNTVMYYLVIAIVIAVVLIVVAYALMRRGKAAAQPPAEQASPWGQPPTGTLPSVGAQPVPAAQPQATPGQSPAQPAYVPPTVERPPQAPAPPSQPVSQAPPALAQPAPAIPQAYQPAQQPPAYQPPSQQTPAYQQPPVIRPQPAQSTPQPQAFTPAPPQPAQDTSRTSYFGQPPAPSQPYQPSTMPAPAPYPAAQAAAPAPSPYTPPAPSPGPALPAPAPVAPAPAAPAGPEMRHFTKKIILIGDGGVGKTTLIRKFVYDMFDDKYIATIGTKVSKKKVLFPETQLDVNLMVWDVQGQRNDPLLTRYFTGAEGALFVCDVTRFQTFENLPEWIKDFEAVCGKVPMIILGNKSDLVDNTQFGESELSALAARYNAKAFLTSAKTGANVESSFKDIARAITK